MSQLTSSAQEMDQEIPQLALTDVEGKSPEEMYKFLKQQAEVFEAYADSISTLVRLHSDSSSATESEADSSSATESFKSGSAHALKKKEKLVVSTAIPVGSISRPTSPSSPTSPTRLGALRSFFSRKAKVQTQPIERKVEVDPVDDKYVALVAHNNMKPSMMAFVEKHHTFFQTCKIVTTQSTGRALEQKLGLSVTEKVASGPLGGDQEIGAMISQNTIGVVFFFRDPLSAHPHDSDIIALTRLCDVHNVLMGTNPRTGDCIVHTLKTCRTQVQVIRSPPGSPRLVRQDSDVVRSYKKQQARVLSK